VRVFGLAVSLALAVTYGFYSQWFISVWCFLAATISAIVLWHFFPEERDPRANGNP
jgi:xanthine/uracil permease